MEENLTNESIAELIAESIKMEIDGMKKELNELKQKPDPRYGEVNLSDTRLFYHRKGVYNEK